MLQRLMLLFVIVVLLTSCSGAGVQEKVGKTLQVRPEQALLTLYLSTSGVAEVDARGWLEEVAIDVDGVWIDLDLEPVRLKYLKLKGEQVLIGAAIAPLGKHRKLRLRCSGLQVGQGGDAEAAQFFQVLLPEPLELRQGESKCLFIDWQLVADQQDRRKLSPAFTSWGQRQTLGGDLLYVGCRDINTVYAVRMDINQVVTAFSVPGSVAGMKVPAGQRRLYILSTGKRAIFVYDSLSARLIDQITLPGSVSPQHLTLSADGRYAYVSDSAAGAVFRVGLIGGNSVNQVKVGHDPQRLIYISGGQGVLAVVSPHSQQILILNAEDLKLQRIIPVGARPSGLLYFAGALYVAESGSQSVAVFNLQTGDQLAKIAVGLQPDFLLSVDRGNAYVSNSGESTLTALIAGQNTAFRKIAVGKNPTEMAFSQRRKLLYVASASSTLVTAVDRVSQQVVKQVNFGGTAESLAILE